MELYIRWMREHPSTPSIKYLSFSNKEVLAQNSPTPHRGLLQTHGYKLQKPNAWLRTTKEMAGNGVIMMECDKHRKHRPQWPLYDHVNQEIEPVFLLKAVEVVQLF
ncbi:hypothetical protein F5Y16DRAFT_365055, partial [Xylariaceae sp. FL0255]